MCIRDRCVLALGPSDASAPPGWHTVDVPAPTLTQAAAAWGSALRTAGARVGRANLAAYASRIPLGEKGIGEVVARAAAAAEARGERLTGDDVAAALRGQPRHDPGGLARQVPTATRLEDLVLSPATRDGLDEVVAHARWSSAAHETLGFDGVRGRAVVALFHGPSGTGKPGPVRRHLQAAPDGVHRDAGGSWFGGSIRPGHWHVEACAAPHAEQHQPQGRRPGNPSPRELRCRS